MNATLLTPTLPRLQRRTPARRAAAPALAIKVVRAGCATAALKEAGVHARIIEDHPGRPFVIRLREAFQASGHVCLAFEKHGIEMYDYTDEHGAVPLSLLRVLARQLLLALDCVHASGLIHTDVKPGNLLWDDATREIRLIDLGSARPKLRQGRGFGSRRFVPPDMYLGLPLGPWIDVWALGPTLFQLATGKSLFDPEKVCEGKYKEFVIPPKPGDFIVNADDDDELDARVFKRGHLLGGKYRLQKELGEGRFGVVWSAIQLHSGDAGEPLPVESEAKKTEDEVRSLRPPRPKGMSVWEVALAYEHFLDMQACLGHFDQALASEGKHYQVLYGPDGEVRFHPDIAPLPIEKRLENHGIPDKSEREAFGAFLRKLMTLDYRQRPSAQALLQDEWIA